MRWDDRQRRMLGALGVRLWAPPSDSSVDEAIDFAAPVPPRSPRGDAGADAARPTPPPSRDGPGAHADAHAGAGGDAATDVGLATTRAAGDERVAAAGDRAASPVSYTDAASQASAAVSAVSVVTAPAPADARAARIASLGWGELREVVAGCAACPLHRGRTQAVFGVGHPGARLMIVGEAPGEQEDARGEPFVGAAGQLLDRMLAAAGFARDAVDAPRAVFIANTLKCRPPRNRNPAPDELERCQPYLARQVALVRPTVLFALGRFAVDQLLGRSEAIGRLRGRVHATSAAFDAATGLGPLPVVVGYHPAYLLRQPLDKAKAWDDLGLVLRQLDAAGELPPWPSPRAP